MGYIIPYMITGILNMHPRSAIVLRAGQDKDKYAELYKSLYKKGCAASQDPEPGSMTRARPTDAPEM